jgi:hypothetical protein
MRTGEFTLRAMSSLADLIGGLDAGEKSVIKLVSLLNHENPEP